MRRSWILICLIVVGTILLSSCAPATTAVPTTTVVAATSTSAPIVIPTSGPATCSIVSKQPTPGPTEVSLYPPPSDKDWTVGPDDAEVTFTVYSDFQCPYCALLDPVLDQLQKDYADKVRTVFRFDPLDFHDKSLISAQAAVAVGQQKKEYFFSLKTTIFEKQADWSSMTESDFKAWVTEQVKALGADMDRFQKDFADDTIKNALLADREFGLNYLPGTPYMLINGVAYQGPRDYASLEATIKLLELEKRQFNECPAMTIDSTKQYQATLKTTKGDIVIQFYADKAPMAVNSFIFLAKNGWFDNVPFHRVIDNFVAQTGDPTGTGFGGPGYAFSTETDPSLTFDAAGVVGMANAGSPNSNGSQFFITFAPLTNLNGKYTVFGHVVSGLDIAESLTRRDPSQTGTLPDPDLILSVTIEEK